MTAPAESRNDSSTAPQAIVPTALLESRPPKRPLKAKPANGRSGMSGISASTLSPPQEVQLVDLNRVLVPVEGDDDRETDGDLARGHADDERREGLADQVGDLREPREGDEVEVRRVEHQLDRHEDDDRVAPREDAENSDREEDDGEAEDLVGGD